MRTTCAPIAYFAFNRPKHTALSLAALARNPEAAHTDLHVFIDGPRNAAERDIIAEVREVVAAARGFRSVTVTAAEDNRGLFASITQGVGEVVADAGRVIVVEDDIVAGPGFLSYMNDALERYEEDAQVGSIHAYAPPVTGLPDYYFLRGADCWGWATWADRWSLFRDDARALLDEIVRSGQIDAFCASHGTSALRLLLRRARGQNQSWAILWHASLFLAGRLTLHPGRSFVDNIGNDNSGIHSASTSVYSPSVIGDYNGLPTDIAVSPAHDAAGLLRDFLDGCAIGRPGTFRHRVLAYYVKCAARFPDWLP